jgi:crotonyl-CoA carboxylase/reductase
MMAAGVNYSGVWAGLGQPDQPLTTAHCFILQDPTLLASFGRWAISETLEKIGDEVVVRATKTTATTKDSGSGDRCFR